jgi:hypothetical protein
MSTASPPRSVAVLDSAVTWTYSCLQSARTSPLHLPTPCGDWDLGELLVQMDESLVAIAEAAEVGHVVVDPQPGRTRAAWQQPLTSAPVSVGDLPLGRDTVALVSTLEIAVHGWDVAVATGQDRLIPEDLAARLYDVALAVVTPEERGPRFGPVVPVPGSAPASARLLGHLGRGLP